MEPYYYYHIPEKKSEIFVKNSTITFWNIDFSNFSKANLKTNFISQSNFSLVLIPSLNHIAVVSICWDMLCPENYSGIISCIFASFYLEKDDINRARIIFCLLVSFYIF